MSDESAKKLRQLFDVDHDPTGNPTGNPTDTNPTGKGFESDELLTALKRMNNGGNDH